MHDAVVLAGGGGRRLGGVSKADLVVDGRRLLDAVLDATRGARAVVVVAPEAVTVPDGVRRTLEDPPGGGPVAGIAAGLAALPDADHGAVPWVLVLACDVPAAARAVPALTGAVGDGTDGAIVADADGRDQPLLGLYRRSTLADVLARLGRDVHGARARDLVDALHLVRIDDPGGAAPDVDTWADAARLGVVRGEEAR